MLSFLELLERAITLYFTHPHPTSNMENKQPLTDGDQTSFATKGSRPTYIFDGQQSSAFFNRFQALYPAHFNSSFASRRSSLDVDREIFERQNFLKRPKRMSVPCEALFFSPRGASVESGTKKHDEEEKYAAMPSLGSSFGLPALSAFSCLGARDSKLSPTQSVLSYVRDCRPFAHTASNLKADSFLTTQLGSLAQVLASDAEKKRRRFEIAATEKQNQENFEQEPKEKKRKEASVDSGEDSADNASDKGENYWERRRRNNASAKKSRDARRARELQTQIKAAFLESENLRLCAELMAIQEENVRLKRVLCAKM